jgi:hypothetical protein
VITYVLLRKFGSYDIIFMNVCSYKHCLRIVIIHCSGIFGFIGLYRNQATDFNDVLSFFWYVTENVRVCIDSVHDTSDIEIYIL